MNRNEQQALNIHVIDNTGRIITRHYNRYRPPSYKYTCLQLNQAKLTTSRGNIWTPKRLFRMLQRNGYSGLWGLHKFMNNK